MKKLLFIALLLLTSCRGRINLTPKLSLINEDLIISLISYDERFESSLLEKVLRGQAHGYCKNYSVKLLTYNIEKDSLSLKRISSPKIKSDIVAYQVITPIDRLNVLAASYEKIYNYFIISIDREKPASIYSSKSKKSIDSFYFDGGEKSSKLTMFKKSGLLGSFAVSSDKKNVLVGTLDGVHLYDNSLKFLKKVDLNKVYSQIGIKSVYEISINYLINKNTILYKLENGKVYLYDFEKDSLVSLTQDILKLKKEFHCDTFLGLYEPRLINGSLSMMLLMQSKKDEELYNRWFFFEKKGNRIKMFEIKDSLNGVIVRDIANNNKLYYIGDIDEAKKTLQLHIIDLSNQKKTIMKLDYSMGFK